MLCNNALLRRIFLDASQVLGGSGLERAIDTHAVPRLTFVGWEGCHIHQVFDILGIAELFSAHHTEAINDVAVLIQCLANGPADPHRGQLSLSARAFAACTPSPPTLPIEPLDPSLARQRRRGSGPTAAPIPQLADLIRAMLTMLTIGQSGSTPGESAAKKTPKGSSARPYRSRLHHDPLSDDAHWHATFVSRLRLKVHCPIVLHLRKLVPIQQPAYATIAPSVVVRDYVSLLSAVNADRRNTANAGVVSPTEALTLWLHARHAPDLTVVLLPPLEPSEIDVTFAVPLRKLLTAPSPPSPALTKQPLPQQPQPQQPQHGTEANGRDEQRYVQQSGLQLNNRARASALEQAAAYHLQQPQAVIVCLWSLMVSREHNQRVLDVARRWDRTLQRTMCLVTSLDLHLNTDSEEEAIKQCEALFAGRSTTAAATTAPQPPHQSPGSTDRSQTTHCALPSTLPPVGTIRCAVAIAPKWRYPAAATASEAFRLALSDETKLLSPQQSSQGERLHQAATGANGPSSGEEEHGFLASLRPSQRRAVFTAPPASSRVGRQRGGSVATGASHVALGTPALSATLIELAFQRWRVGAAHNLRALVGSLRRQLSANAVFNVQSLATSLERLPSDLVD